jgi:hypothetical protein
MQSGLHTRDRIEQLERNAIEHHARQHREAGTVIATPDIMASARYYR